MCLGRLYWVFWFKLSKEYILSVYSDKRITKFFEVERHLESLLLKEKIYPSLVIHNGYSSLDLLIASWCFKNNINTKIIKPNWDLWGISAEHKNFEEKLRNSDFMVAFLEKPISIEKVYLIQVDSSFY